MRIVNILRVILAVFIATLLMTFMVDILIMCAAPIMGRPKEEITNSPLTAQIEQMWVPDGTLNSIYCRVKDRTMIKENIDLVMVLKVESNSSQPIKIANYSLEARSPLNKEWKQIKGVKPVLSNQFYAEYVDSNNPTPKYLDFSKDSFDILAQTKAIELGDSITGWSFFDFGYKPDLKGMRFRLKLYNAGGEVIQQIEELREGDNMFWISLKAIDNPLALCKSARAPLETYPSY